MFYEREGGEIAVRQDRIPEAAVRIADATITNPMSCPVEGEYIGTTDSLTIAAQRTPYDRKIMVCMVQGEDTG